MILHYKSLIDFNDKMEKSNFSYISILIKRKKFSEDERIQILKYVIDIHKRYSVHKEKSVALLRNL